MDTERYQKMLFGSGKVLSKVNIGGEGVTQILNKILKKILRLNNAETKMAKNK